MVIGGESKLGNNTEIELKLRFEESSVWDRITEDAVFRDMAAQGSWNIEELETVYFDTPGQILQKKGYAYRIRRQENGWVATMKGLGSSHGGLHQREEWSVDVREPVPDISPFLTTPAGNVLKDILVNEDLQELFRTRFKRKFILLNLPQNTVVELAADLGAIIKEEAYIPIAEIELELKGGSLAQLLRLGAVLSGKYGLRPEYSSKYDRGLELSGLKNKGSGPSKNCPEQDKTKSSETFLNIITCIQKALLIQDKLFRDPDDLESYKQMCLVLVTIRILLSKYCPALGSDRFSWIEALDLETQKIARLIDLPPLTGEQTLNSPKMENHTPLLLDLWAAALAAEKAES